MSEVNEVNEASPEEMTELEKLIRSSKPWFEANGTILIYALAGVLLIAAAVVYFNRQPDGNVQATSDLMLASSAEEYRDVADAYPDMELGVWARLQQADRLLDDCVAGMFSDREEGLELMETAGTTYQRLADSKDLPDAVRERVFIGQARLKEVGCDGTEEAARDAIAAWQKVLDEYPETIIKDYAESRIAQLDTADSRRFYAWFHNIKPEPIDPGLSEGQPGVPNVPGGLEDLLQGGPVPGGPVPGGAAPDGQAPEGQAPEGDAEGEGPATESTESTEPETEAETPGGAPVIPEIPAAGTETPPTGNEPATTEDGGTEGTGTGTDGSEPDSGTETPPVESGEQPAGETPAENTPAGETPSGDAPTGDAPTGDTPGTETPAEPPAGGTEPTTEDPPR